MYIYDIITETFVEFYYRDLNTPTIYVQKRVCLEYKTKVT